MDTGKILLGIALVMFSGALMVNPSGAAVYDASPQVGSGDVFVAGTLTADDFMSTAQVRGMDQACSDPAFVICCNSGFTTQSW